MLTTRDSRDLYRTADEIFQINRNEQQQNKCWILEPF